MDATVTNPGSGIKLFGMVISVPPLSRSSTALPVLELVDHQAEETSSSVKKSGNGKEKSLFKLQQLAQKNGPFGYAFDEIAASSSSTNTSYLTETPSETATSIKSTSSIARGKCRKTIDEHCHSAGMEREDDHKTDVSKNEDPRKIDDSLPCPRCDSRQTKFCYFNNYNVNQPRHFCKQCQRYWTAGGTLRSVPLGAGLRKNKQPDQTIDVAHVDRMIARENAAVAAHQPRYSFGKPCSINMPTSSPRLCCMLPEALPELELRLAGNSDNSDHLSIGQMFKAVADCDEGFCLEKMLPVEFAIRSNMKSQRGCPRSRAGAPFHTESFNNSWGAAARAGATLAAAVVATKSHFDSPELTSLGKHPRDTNIYRGDSEMCELARSRHGRTQYVAKNFFSW